jgi:hypothetical protein
MSRRTVYVVGSAVAALVHLPTILITITHLAMFSMVYSYAMLSCYADAYYRLIDTGQIVLDL